MDDNTNQVTQQSTLEQSKNVKNSFSLVSLILTGVFTLGLGFGIGIIVSGNKIDNSQKVNEKIVAVTPTKAIKQTSPQSKSSVDFSLYAHSTEIFPTDNWKTYEDTDLKYSIKYPPNWFFVPGTWKKIEGYWGGSSTYLANKEDKEYGKSFDDRKLPIDFTDLCSISINAVPLDGKSFEDVVISHRGLEGLIHTTFNESEAIFIPMKTKNEQSSYSDEAELWYLGAIPEHVYYISMYSDSKMSGSCRGYYNTLLTTYK